MILLFAEDAATISTTNFWVIVSLFATLLAYLIRSEYNRWRDKKTEESAAKRLKEEREAERKELADAVDKVRQEREEVAARIKAEQREVEEQVRKELERSNAVIKEELRLHYEREKLELEKTAFRVIAKLGEHEQVFQKIDGKIVTLTKAAEHKDELKEAIQESTEKASAAYEVANTINEKLAEMSKAGQLSKEQEKGRAEIDEMEKGENEK